MKSSNISHFLDKSPLTKSFVLANHTTKACVERICRLRFSCKNDEKKTHRTQEKRQYATGISATRELFDKRVIPRETSVTRLLSHHRSIFFVLFYSFTFLPIVPSIAIVVIEKPLYTEESS